MMMGIGQANVIQVGTTAASPTSCPTGYALTSIPLTAGGTGNVCVNSVGETPDQVASLVAGTQRQNAKSYPIWAVTALACGAILLLAPGGWKWAALPVGVGGYMLGGLSAVQL